MAALITLLNAIPVYLFGNQRIIITTPKCRRLLIFDVLLLW